MCGRVNVTDDPAVRALCECLGVDLGPDPVQIRFNIAPGEPLLTLYKPADKIEKAEMEWGIVPPWTKPGKFSRPLINARAETIWEKPSFRKLITRRRAAAIVTGFYEWKREHGTKRAFHFHPRGNLVFAIAAIWQVSKHGVLQICLITTGPNQVMEPIHNRMPVLLAPESIRTWLENDDRETLNNLMIPPPDEWITAYEVSDYVNDARHEGPECIEP